MTEHAYTLPPLRLTADHKALAEASLAARIEALRAGGYGLEADILAALLHALRNARES